MQHCLQAKYIAQLILAGGQAVGRAFRQALQQEYRATMSAHNAAEEAGRSGTQAAKASSLTGMSLGEAKQILNIKDLNDTSTILKNYEHLFKINAKSTGGSFYLQSKVYRARERIEMELDAPLTTEQQTDTNQTDTNDRQDQTS